MCVLALVTRLSFSTGTHNVTGCSVERSVQVADSLNSLPFLGRCYFLWLWTKAELAIPVDA